MDTDQIVLAKYPTIGPVGAAVGAITGGFIGMSWALPAYIYLCAAGVLLAYIDADTLRLPNIIVLPSYLIFGGLLLLPVVGTGDWGAFVGALIGGVAMFGLYLLLALVNPKAMGMGDVKLAGLLGMALGWFGLQPWLIGFLLAFFIGAAVGIIAMAMGRATRHTKIPFGPSMLVGAWIAILIGTL